MTKRELLAALAVLPDDAEIVVEGAKCMDSKRQEYMDSAEFRPIKLTSGYPLPGLYNMCRPGSDEHVLKQAYILVHTEGGRPFV